MAASSTFIPHCIVNKQHVSSTTWSRAFKKQVQFLSITVLNSDVTIRAQFSRKTEFTSVPFILSSPLCMQIPCIHPSLLCIMSDMETLDC
jgi:hypothetical protein